MQSLIVALLVMVCSVYAAWNLMPAAARRAIALALLNLPLPNALALHMRTVATRASCGGCGGCERAAAASLPTAAQVVKFHPRARR